MKGSEFVKTYASQPFTAWEAAVVNAAKTGGLVQWPLVPVTMTDGRRSLVIQVASDYVSVGEPDDFVRVPLTPIAAQKVADTWGMLLPTCALVKAIYEQAAVKVSPVRSTELRPPEQNKGANLGQYTRHSLAVDAQLASLKVPMGRLVSGHKKDVVIGNLWKPGKVLIYGWFKGQPPVGPDPYPTMGDPAINNPPWRIQMYSNVHGDFYVDYSHGIRLVAPQAVLDGQPVSLAAILSDASTASLASWEGPLKMTRYPTPGKSAPSPQAYVPTSPDLAARGLVRVQEDYVHGEKDS